MAYAPTDVPESQVGAAPRRPLLPVGRARHRTQSRTEYLAAKTRILILGGGFGGISTALELDRQFATMPDTSVLLVSRDNYQLFFPLLWPVAGGRANPSNVVVPLRAFQRRRAFHLLHADIQHIDLDHRTITTSGGILPFDVLVIALGSVVTVPDLPGLRQNAHIFHSPADAIDLRNRLIDAIEIAHQCDDPRERDEWLTFVVGGGGDTGVELAATIHEYIQRGLLARYPWLVTTPLRIIVIQRQPRLVPMGDPATSEAVQRTLEKAGIEVMTGVSIIGATERTIRTSSGEIPTRSIFWAAGITAPQVVRDLPVQHAPNGAIIVDGYLRIPDHPNVWVVGDATWAFDEKTGDPLPPTAQAAEHEGAYVGKAIAVTLAGQTLEPFHFKVLGHLALLGSFTGVAELGKLRFTGLPAWALWHAYYLSHIPSWRNRAYLLGSWFLAALFGRDTTQLRLEQETGDVEMERKL